MKPFGHATGLWLIATVMVSGQVPPADRPPILPAGFEGIRLGMTTQELVKEHPGLVSIAPRNDSSFDPAKGIDTSLPDQTLKAIDEREHDPTLNNVAFWIQGGVLTRCFFQHEPAREAYLETLHRIVERYRSSHQSPPERYVLQEMDDGRVVCAPTLAWRTETHVVILIADPEFPKVMKFYDPPTREIRIIVSSDAKFDLGKEFKLESLAKEYRPADLTQDEKNLLFASIGLEEK